MKNLSPSLAFCLLLFVLSCNKENDNLPIPISNYQASGTRKSFSTDSLLLNGKKIELLWNNFIYADGKLEIPYKIDGMIPRPVGRGNSSQKGRESYYRFI